MERLRLLRQMSIQDAAECIREYSPDPRSWQYLASRLEYYDKLVSGRVKQKEQTYNYQTGQYQDSYIEPRDLTKYNIEVGILRDMMYAAMIGSPEMAMVKMATRRAKERHGEDKIKGSVVTLKGYYSGIFPYNASYEDPQEQEGYRRQIEEDYGMGLYPKLRKLYNRNIERIERGLDPDQEINDSALEHMAVMQGVEQLTKAYEYGGTMDTSASSYSAGFDESVIAGQLGHQVMRQMRGMRRKIQQTDFHNISRFIGRSGDNKYGQERKELEEEIKVLQGWDSEKKRALLEERNSRELSGALNRFLDQEQELKDWWYARRQETDEADLPEEEKELRNAQLDDEYRARYAQAHAQHLAENERIQARGPEQLLTDLEGRKETVDKRYEKRKSLAQKALDLHFIFNGYDRQNETHPPHADVIDWINEAPIGLVNWSHNALSKGVSQEAVFSYSFARYAFPEIPVTRELMGLVQRQNFDRNALMNLRNTQKVMGELNIEYTPEEVIALSEYSESILRARLEQGYTKDALVNYPWLNDNSLPTQELFPFDRTKNAQEAWCSKYAFYVPEGWRRKGFGGLILTRLNQRVDPTLHDATFWLKEFELPDQTPEATYRDKPTEFSLLFALTQVPEDQQFRVPTNPNKYTDLFSSSARLALWEGMLGKFKTGPIDAEQLQEIVDRLLEEMLTKSEEITRKGISLNKYKEDLEEALEAIKEKMSQDEERGKIPVLISDLRGVAEGRKKATDEAYNWFMAHSQTPPALLTFAWQNRQAALAEGCEDNPRAIKQWAELNGLRSAYEQMEQSGELPAGFTRQDLFEMRNWSQELVRCYDGRTVIKELAKLKEKQNPDFLITPLKIDLGDGWTGEVLRKDDPRGMTIGYDTGCCMTLNGISDSCIKAGYAKPSYGFFALYRDGRLVAQSFLYTNQDREESALILDNIEANQGRDMGQVVSRYNQFFDNYLQTQLRRNFGTRFTKVHVGTGYSDVGLDSCPPTSSISMPDAGIYTDASNQRLLYAMPPELMKKCEQFDAEVFDSSLGWNSVKNEILAIERSAFDKGQYSEEQLEKEFTHPDSIAVLLRDGERIIGYCTAYPIAHGENKALYVSSTAIVPEYQKQGLVNDLMYKLEVEALKQGYTTLTRHAMVEKGYADTLEKNYEIVERSRDEDTPIGKQRFLAMRIPPHPQSRLLEPKPKERQERKVAVLPLTEDDISLIASMERQCYPEDAVQGEEFFAGVFENEEKIRQEVGRSDLRFSFLARKGQEPAGYIIVLPEESEVNHGEMTAHIQDMAVLPQFRGTEIARELLDKVLEMVKDYKEQSQNQAESPANFQGAIEMEARAGTSYKLLMNPRVQLWLRQRGYEITHTREMPQYLGNEDYHYVRLEEVKESTAVA